MKPNADLNGRFNGQIYHKIALKTDKFITTYTFEISQILSPEFWVLSKSKFQVGFSGHDDYNNKN